DHSCGLSVLLGLHVPPVGRLAAPQKPQGGLSPPLCGCVGGVSEAHVRSRILLDRESWEIALSEQQKDAHETWVSGAVAMMKQNVPARHIADRLALLLGYAEITWLDGSVRDEQGRLSGQLVVFTEHHVAVVA